MKKKPVKFTGLSDEVDCNVPDYKTVIVVSSQDQLNITLSKCGLAMLGNLGTVRAGRGSSLPGTVESLSVAAPSSSAGVCRGGQADGRVLPEGRGSVPGEEPPGPARLGPPQ